MVGWLYWVVAGVALIAGVASLLAYRRSKRRLHLVIVPICVVVTLVGAYLGAGMPGMEYLFKRQTIRVVLHRDPFDVVFKEGIPRSLTSGAPLEAASPPFQDKNVEELEFPLTETYRLHPTHPLHPGEPPDVVHRFKGTAGGYVDFLIKDGKIEGWSVTYGNRDPRQP